MYLIIIAVDKKKSPKSLEKNGGVILKKGWLTKNPQTFIKKKPKKDWIIKNL